jgi:DNA-binding protein H-NS
MSRLEELEKQQAAIAQAIENEKAKVRDQVVFDVRNAIKTYGITLSEVKNVLTMRKPRAKTAAKASKASSGAPKKRGRPRKNA